MVESGLLNTGDQNRFGVEKVVELGMGILDTIAIKLQNGIHAITVRRWRVSSRSR